MRAQNHVKGCDWLSFCFSYVTMSLSDVKLPFLRRLSSAQNESGSDSNKELHLRLARRGKWTNYALVKSPLSPIGKGGRQLHHDEKESEQG